jgi:hypothetical protein
MTALRDVLGIEIRPGDRVWLVVATRTGLERVCAGTVLGFVDDRVAWQSDPMTPAEWKRLTWGCSVNSYGAYAPPSPDNEELHFSSPAALKVVGRARETLIAGGHP